MKKLFDPSFRYTPSYATDVRKTFERIRGERQPLNGTALSPEQVGEKVLRLTRKAGSK